MGELWERRQDITALLRQELSALVKCFEDHPTGIMEMNVLVFAPSVVWAKVSVTIEFEDW
jgi:hypothetical protein